MAAIIGACSGAPASAVVPEALEEITVTARKVSEARFDVPLSIDVIPADALPSGLPLDLSRLALLSPGLYFESLWGGLGAAPVLRGQSQPSTAGDNVGVFVDGVYQAERTAIDSVPIDIEQVEVVRGPQSTLFGQSTFAGAIHYVPRSPTRAVAAGAEAVVGTDEYLAANAYLSGPLKEGIALGRLAVGFRDSHGAQTNSANDTSLGDRRASRGRRHAGFRLGRTVERETLRPLDVREPGASSGVERDWRRLQLRCRRSGDEHVELLLWNAAAGSALRRFARRSGQPARREPGRSRRVVARRRSQLYQRHRLLPRSHRNVPRLRCVGHRRNVWCVHFARLPVRPGSAVARRSARRSQFRVPAPIRRVGVDPGVPAAGHAVASALVDDRLDRHRHAEFGSLGVRVQARRPRDERGVDDPAAADPGLGGPVARANVSLVDDPNRQQVMQASVRSIVAPSPYSAASTTGRPSSGPCVQKAARRASTSKSPAARSRRRDSPTRRLDSACSTSRGKRTALRLRGQGLACRRHQRHHRAAAERADVRAEYNWTYELGGRIERTRWSADATIYYIDWQDTQLPGFPLTPGINTLITRNTAGVTTEVVGWRSGRDCASASACERRTSHAASEFCHRQRRSGLKCLLRSQGREHPLVLLPRRTIAQRQCAEWNLCALYR